MGFNIKILVAFMSWVHLQCPNMKNVTYNSNTILNFNATVFHQKINHYTSHNLASSTHIFFVPPQSCTSVCATHPQPPTRARTHTLRGHLKILQNCFLRKEKCRPQFCYLSQGTIKMQNVADYISSTSTQNA